MFYETYLLQSCNRRMLQVAQVADRGRRIYSFSL